MAEIFLQKALFPAESIFDLWDKTTALLGMPDTGFLSQLPPNVQRLLEGMQQPKAVPWEETFPDSVFPNSEGDFLNCT